MTTINLDYNQIVIMAEDEWNLQCNENSSQRFHGIVGGLQWMCAFVNQNTLCVKLMNKEKEVHTELFIYSKTNESDAYSLWSGESFDNPLRAILSPSRCEWRHSFPERKEFVKVTIRLLGERQAFHDFTIDKPAKGLMNDGKLRAGGQVFNVNKQMLGSLSPKFVELLNTENEGIIDTGESDATLFHDFLLAIMPVSDGSVLPNSQNLSGLLRLGKQYQVNCVAAKFFRSLELCREMPLIERVLLAKKYGDNDLHNALMNSVMNIGEAKRLCVALMQRDV